VFGQLYVPEVVLQEAAVPGRRGEAEIHAAVAAGHIVVRKVDPELEEADLDEGEATAIALARATSRTVILDDREALAYAMRSGIPLTGTLAVLVRLKRDGKIDRLARALDQLEAIGFRMTPALRRAALTAVGEA
jgi:predicted nucleic acid-binding protein